MNQIPNIEETHNTREVEEIVDKKLKQISNYIFSRSISLQDSAKYERQVWIDTLHQQLQKDRQDWLRSEIEKLEGVKTNYVQGMENGLLHHREPCQCQTCVDKRNDTLTSIITRYKEELLELDKTSGL